MKKIKNFLQVLPTSLLHGKLKRPRNYRFGHATPITFKVMDFEMLAKRLNSVDESSAGNDGSRVIPVLLPLAGPAPIKERRHATFFDVVNSSLAINTPEQFRAWMQSALQHIFPHGMAACGIGLIENIGARIQQYISCNFPDEYIQALQQPNGLINSPIIAQWIKTRRPVIYEMTAQDCNSKWLKNFKRFDLQNMVVHGQCDLHSRTTSYFVFARIPDKLTHRHANLLEMLVPHLHTTLIRALNGAKNESLVPKTILPVLTEREHEILQWLGSGKTNWEIAQVLHISEYTVKNHVQRILIKLKVNTRAQAVSKGLFPG